MESHTMFRHLVRPRAALGVLLLVGAAGQSPAFAQEVNQQGALVANWGPSNVIDLDGSWVPAQTEDVSNDPVSPVEYMGIPLNEAARTRAQSYNDLQLSTNEHQCEGFGATYILTGPFGLKISANYDVLKGDLVSYTMPAWEDKVGLVIWMDGRPHPSPNAEHTRGGFTTGRWENGELVAVTTHMQQAFIRKNGPPLSDAAKMTLRFKRRENRLLVIGIIEDPIYLAEPMVWTRDYVLSTRPLLGSTVPCLFAYEGAPFTHDVPHYLWGNKPFQDELVKKFGIPQDAVLGYPETLYPEYRLKMQQTKAAGGK